MTTDTQPIQNKGGRGHRKDPDNVYAKAREKAARENRQIGGALSVKNKSDVALAVNVSLESLIDYEKGETPVSPDIVLNMVEVYGTPELRVQHCRDHCVLGKYNYGNIDMENASLEKIAIKLFRALTAADEAKQLLLDIVEDGKIDDSELEAVQKLFGALNSVQFYAQELSLHLEDDEDIATDNVKAWLGENVFSKANYCG